MKKLLAIALCLAVAMTMLVLPAASAEGTKVYRTYLTTDCDTLYGGSTVQSQSNTTTEYCSAYLYRAYPDESGTNYHYICDIAAELPIQIDDYNWQIKIRPEAHWANGDPINADTFMYTFKMELDPLLLNQVADFLADNDITIVNAKAYNLQGVKQPGDEGYVAWEDVGIKKIDDYTIQITTEKVNTQRQVCSHFNNRANVPVYEPLYEAGMNSDRTQTTYGATIDQWMSCGPYTLTTWTFDSVQVYTKNPTYWLADLFHYDTVEVYILPEMNARVQMFEKGELDDLSPDSATVDTYYDDPRLVEYSSNTVYHIDVNGSNPNNPLCSSLNYRKALYFAMNRRVIAEDLFGHMEPAGWYISGQAGLFNDITYRNSEYGQAVVDMVNSWGDAGYNPETALEYMKAAFAECGLSETDVVTLRIAYDPSDAQGRWNATAQYLVEEFKTIFNGMIVLEIDNYSGISTTEYKKNHDNWDLSPNDWSRTAARTYPYQAFYYFLSTYASHPNNYFDEEFEAQFQVCADTQSDYMACLAETQKLEEIYLEKVIQIPVVQEISFSLFSDRLVLPVTTYVPGFGWGNIYGDIAE